MHYEYNPRKFVKKVAEKIKISKSRSTGTNTTNRFEEIYIDYHDENLEHEYFDEFFPIIETKFYNDTSRTILARNNSPDLGFNYSINPYRGCEHGCIYCYARPSHEYLGFSAGLDFETKIMVKKDAAVLLEHEFLKKSWKAEIIMLSGNTDCYQPVERKLKITRELLKVFSRFRNPVAIISKNALIQRDIDLLKELAEFQLVTVTISVTTLNRELSRKLEPRTSVPKKRLETIEILAKNGIPVGINLAPVIPGLNDEEIPSILKLSSERGASWAANEMLRLPYSVKDLFIEWLNRNYPEKVSKIINRIKEIRSGKISESEFGKRLTGEGELADAIHKIFDLSCQKYGLNKQKIKLRTDLFTNQNTLQFDLFN